MNSNMELKEEIYTQILSDSVLQGQIMSETGKSFSTIRRWAVEKKPELTQYAILALLANYLDTTIDELLKK